MKLFSYKQHSDAAGRHVNDGPHPILEWRVGSCDKTRVKGKGTAAR